MVATSGYAEVKLAEQVLTETGFAIVERNHKVSRSSATMAFVATDALGSRWMFDVPGGFTSHRGGLQRLDTVWKALGRLSAVRGRTPAAVPIVLLTTHLPRRSSEGDVALRAAGHGLVFDAIDVLATADRDRLARYAAGDAADRPLEGFWSEVELA